MYILDKNIILSYTKFVYTHIQCKWYYIILHDLLVNERLEICSLLLDQFNSVFTSPITNMIVHDPISFFSCQSLNPDKCLTDIEITEQIIIDSIKEISSTSAAGTDGVLSSLLFKCAAELAPALKVMFSLHHLKEQPLPQSTN